jgi:uncharacterized protein YeaO (DUF488 family)
MQKSLKQLSEEYFKAANDLEIIIEKYRKQLNEAYRSRNYLKTYEIKRKLTVFYDQKNEALTTAHQLKNYYEDPKEKKSA